MPASIRNERGTVIILLTVFLFLLLCFVAFGTEAGRWFLVRSELSKSVDAAALAGARNLSNPHVDPAQVALDFGRENFPPGAHGSASTGAVFTAQLENGDRIEVTGQATSVPAMGRLLDVDEVVVGSGAMAQKREAEIMMILDRSGSMVGTPIANLKTASKNFLDHFAATQDRDRVGLISFNTMARVDRPMGSNFVTPMKTAIDAMQAVSFTNTDDAILLADGPDGFTDQSSTPGERRVQQFVVFFSDGMPTAFHDAFMRNGVRYEAIVLATTNFIGGCAGFSDDTRLLDAATGASLPIYAVPTGDGRPLSSTSCGRLTTRWYAFDASPVPGYAPDACSIPASALDDYFCDEARRQAIANAEVLKDQGVVVFAIGLGNVDRTFLGQLASGPDFVFYTPNSDQLDALFQQVAQQIQLRLVR